MAHHTNRRTADGNPLYPNYAIRLTHPDRLAMLARLHGISAANVEACRVLELGCAGGGNVLPMAELLPDSKFVGIDMQPEHIEYATNVAKDLGIGNVEFQTLNILDTDPTLGEFDYILCHGVFTWTPKEVQDGILSACRDLLSENGVAYINLNLFPGWSTQAVLKEFLRQATAGIDEPEPRIAKAKESLRLIQAHYSQFPGAQAAAIKQQVDMISKHDDGFLFHAYLDARTYPIYFEDFCERLSQHGLEYICDAHQSNWLRECELLNFNSALPSDRLLREQQLDFFENRGARYSLISKAKANRWKALDANAFRSLYLIGNITEATTAVGTPSDKIGFRNDLNQVVAVHAETAKVLRQLESAEDCFIQLQNAIPDEAAPEFRILAHEILQLADVLVYLSNRPPTFSLTTPSELRVSTFAAHQAATGEAITTLDHNCAKMSQETRDVFAQLNVRSSQPEVSDATIQELLQRRYLMR